MSDFWTSPSQEQDRVSRRRALWGLLILAGVALLIVGLIVILVGRPGGGQHRNAVADTGSTASTTQPETSSSTPSESPTPTATTGTASQTSSSAACPSAAPCVLGGSDGGAILALNAFRTSHGRPAAPGAVTSEAQQCALSQGDGPTCQPHYAWQPAPALDGRKVIDLIASRPDGAAWLLDSQLTSFSVGWALVPGPAGRSGQYECAILKVG